MKRKESQQFSQLNSEIFGSRGTVKPIEENNFEGKDSEREKEQYALFAFQFDERFTKIDACCTFLLGAVIVILLSNIHSHFKPRVEASLLHAFPLKEITSIQNYKPLKVINPIPDEPKVRLERLPMSKSLVTNMDEPNRLAVNTRIYKKTLFTKTDLERTNTVTLRQPKAQKAVKPIIKNTPEQPVTMPTTPAVATWAQTKQKAMAEGKPSFILFGASYCMPCKMMRDVMTKHHNVEAYIGQHYLYKYIDIQSLEGRWTTSKYNIQTLPTLVIFDKNGYQVAKYEEALSSNALLDVLQTYDDRPNLEESAR